MDTHALILFIGQNAPQLVGLLLPPVVTVLNQSVTDHRSKFLVTFMLCIFVAVLLNVQKIITGDALTSFESLSTSILLVFTESQAVYRLYFKGSAIEAHIEAKSQA